ncbi:MAG: discoidin domain-containing protein, partial [Oscillospiraceae bacterium]|nr:discoidin domain-containing protein [Oscillospiraceae bacterium]
MKKFNRIVSLLLVLCMVLSIVPALSLARAADADADLWVDPVNGNDANDGTTEATALKTINAAKTKAAELSANGDVVVILKGGTYDATETITFGEAESGKNGNTITYRAASGETALISGGTEIEGWTLHDANHNIYVADIPEGAELIRQFYVNGEPQPMASTELTPTGLNVFSSTGYRSGVISSADNTHYLTVDLGEGKLVSSVTLYGDYEASATTGKAMGFPKDFTIQTSPDGYTWTTQVTETDFSAPGALGGVEFNFSSTAARYVKIEATE